MTYTPALHTLKHSSCGLLVTLVFLHCFVTLLHLYIYAMYEVCYSLSIINYKHVLTVLFTETCHKLFLEVIIQHILDRKTFPYVPLHTFNDTVYTTFLILTEAFSCSSNSLFVCVEDTNPQFTHETE